MPRYRNDLPQLGDRIFLTDGGLETTLVFHEGRELPHFAAFDLLRTDEGRTALTRYFRRYAGVAAAQRRGLVLETPTWRASREWGERLGYDADSLADAGRRSVALLEEIRSEWERPETPIVISGNLGPRGDGYRADARMSPAEAEAYHLPQIETFAGTAADMVAAFTMTHTGEAIGIALGARRAGMPVAISFTTETDGRLPSGESLGDAIEQTDLATGSYPAYYMINCAHPTHITPALGAGGEWRERIRGLRANASTRSHAELDESPDLDAGNPEALALEYRQLHADFPRLAVVGGCCGTDHRHVAEIGRRLP
jgi:S-methylmethionine-dependent homocysteine/selenocysteine methylase